MPRLILWSLFMMIGSSLFAQKPDLGKNKSQAADTVVLAEMPDSLLVPFEPYEANFQAALKTAVGSKERTRIFKVYMDALFSSTLPEDKKTALLKRKIRHYMDIDFYSLYEYQLLVAKEADNKKPLFFIRTFRNTATEAQQAAFTEYMKYAVESAKALVYNQSTGQTEELQVPPTWPAGLPYPGFGWGKYISTDNVATPVSMQYHLSETERYKIIDGYKKEGKKISPDDQAWYTAYEVHHPKAKTPGGQSGNQGAEIPIETRLSNLVGVYFSYSAESRLDCTTCRVISYKDQNEIYLQCKYGVAKKATYDELVNNKNLHGYKMARAVLEKCRACNGQGVVKSSFSHTNDYQYTLGKKITYTKTTVSTCGICAGSGYQDRF